MTCNEFLDTIKSRGAVLLPPSTPHEISLTNTTLQLHRNAMLPQFMNELYTHTGGIILGNGCIFGPTEIPQGTRFPIPSITQVCDDFSHTPSMIGKTLFGRNDLFWFSFDAFGICYMLDNLTLSPLRRYDDPHKSLIDCLIAGKV